MDTTTVHQGQTLRESVVILSLKLVIGLFLLDTLYSLVTILLFDIPLLQSFHADLVTVLFLAHFIKNVVSIYLVISVVLSWVGNVYFVSNKYLVRRSGILHITEKLYDLKLIRTVNISQGILGKLFHFGNVHIETSASGGYIEKINLTGITNPEQWRNHFEKCLQMSA